MVLWVIFEIILHYVTKQDVKYSGHEKSIVCKGVLSPHFKIIPAPYQKIGHPKYSLINRNPTVKLFSINTINIKQQHNVGFSIFKFTLKYILGNVYINKIHPRQSLCYIINKLYFFLSLFLWSKVKKIHYSELIAERLN